VSNLLGVVDSGFATLLVTNAPPIIVTQPESDSVLTGATAMFTVEAAGTPPLHYQWYYNTNTVLTGETNASLLLTDVQLTTAGTYSVTITNSFGSTASDFAVLTVTTNGSVAIPDGYATQNGGTTGGGGATPVTVSTASAFRSAVGNSTPAVIVVEGMIDLNGDVTIRANKTIRGADSSAGLYGGTVKIQDSNYIIQNLSFGPASGDVMEISGANNVFITNCEFHDSTDELCSIVREADYVTVSWSKFYFDNPDSHSFAHLIGNSDGATSDRGKLHVTLHHNWYTAGVRGRIPRVRFGHVHLYNNYYNSIGNGYCIGIGFECHIRVENTHFDGINNAWADYGGTSNGELGWDNLKFTGGSTQPTFMPNTFSTIFVPPYAYSMDPVDDVQAIVTAGAGNVP
jgi:pectate lyase